ncbi:hypothetical protein ACQ0P8_10030 [Halodesulfovibrio aestuarii]|uniref:Uncharacterized protein n=1 Tax=Halodesulfovibrio aestuarii TaxID=126333 RepID=A0A8G2C9L1_9BACT|nr:hypothetical protein [Halodesulfovibrio aestuarii]SHI98659.1 hypothetical protein SAMN05660830_01279 [Halodesulfovibrio aestuarii]
MNEYDVARLIVRLFSVEIAPEERIKLLDEYFPVLADLDGDPQVFQNMASLSLVFPDNSGFQVVVSKSTLADGEE